jgi:hypothetical protein
LGILSYYGQDQLCQFCFHIDPTLI